MKYHTVNEHLYLQQIGGTYAHPVIAPPAVAIGAVGKIQVNCFVVSPGTRSIPTKN